MNPQELVSGINYYFPKPSGDGFWEFCFIEPYKGSNKYFKFYCEALSFGDFESGIMFISLGEVFKLLERPIKPASNIKIRRSPRRPSLYPSRRVYFDAIRYGILRRRLERDPNFYPPHLVPPSFDDRDIPF